MIYISNCCLRGKTLRGVISQLYENGFSNIEISNCSQYQDSTHAEEIISELKEKYNLNLLLHNYSIIADKHFVLNLASLNNEVYKKTLQYLEKSIKASKQLGVNKFSFHAGFLIDIAAGELGKRLRAKKLFNKNDSLKRFYEGFKILESEADGIALYIENNVLSFLNSKVYKNKNVCLLTHHNEYLELKRNINFRLLLDVGHLKISSHSCNLDYHKELDKMIEISDYIHLSDNDGLYDQNRCFSPRSQLLKLLKEYNLKDRIITLETRGNIKEIKQSYSLVSNIIQ